MSDSSPTDGQGSGKLAALTCLGFLGLVGIIAAIVVITLAIAGPAESPDELREPTEVSIPPAASHLAAARSHPRALKVDPGRPTIWVAIEQKVSHGELRRIAQDMRAWWRGRHSRGPTRLGSGFVWSRMRRSKTRPSSRLLAVVLDTLALAYRVTARADPWQLSGTGYRQLRRTAVTRSPRAPSQTC